ncbi:MAG: hypothetical protein L0177_02400 [Chloroflexi bacterium]|nr:hypothetical protein [Chloroflexota bacterium]
MSGKEFEPDDPMELVGVQIPGGNIDEVADGLIQEYLMMGWTQLQVLFLFRSPYYAATHQIYRMKGEAYVKERIQRLAEQWRRGWIAAGGD